MIIVLVRMFITQGAAAEDSVSPQKVHLHQVVAAEAVQVANLVVIQRLPIPAAAGAEVQRLMGMVAQVS